MKERYQVFVAGEWQLEKAKPYAEEAKKIGVLLAQAGFTLTCGPGSGLAGFVLQGYDSVRKSDPSLPKPRFYLPKLSEMNRVGEKEETYGIEVEIIKTDMDYPSRNVRQVRESDAMIAVTGGPGTVTEVINAVYDFNLPVAVLEGSGNMVNSIKSLPQIKEKVFFGNNAEELVSYIKQQLSSKGEGDSPNNTIFIST